MTELIKSLFIGVGLAAAAGFRVFLPLLGLSIASHFNVIPLGESWEWVGSYPAMLTLGVATFLEIGAYYIPWFDNLLDSLAVPLATFAGTALVASTLVDTSPILQWSMAIIAGGGTAAAIKSGNAGVRAASTATTGGLGNPIVSTAETGASIMMAVLSIMFPIVAFIVAIVVVFFTLKLLFKIFSRKKSPNVTH